MKHIPVKTKAVRVSLKERSYDILIGAGALADIGYHTARLGNVTNVTVVTTPHIASFYVNRLQRAMTLSKLPFNVHLIPDGESAKNESVLFNIFHHLLRSNADRGSVLVAFGGGVVGDLTGFAASVFMRGIRWIQVPTTLLAQVDAAIGGKTAINLKEGKNLIGTFFQPNLVLSDVSLLHTLPTPELATGFAEVIKHGMIEGESLFRYLEDSAYDLLRSNVKVLEKVVRESSRIKGQIVSKDEREKSNLRMHLNLGHTFAHAIERESGYRKVSHGQAVAVGLVAAAKLSRLKGWLKDGEVGRVIHLIRRVQLPSSLSELGLRPDIVMRAMEHDKKKKKGVLRFVLPKRFGQIVVTDKVKPAQIKQALA